MGTKAAVGSWGVVPYGVYPGGGGGNAPGAGCEFGWGYACGWGYGCGWGGPCGYGGWPEIWKSKN